jgi:hypothetical protein
MAFEQTAADRPAVAARRFATPPQPANALRLRARTAEVPARVTGGRVEGDDRRLRRWWEARLQAYVLAIWGK